MSGHNRYTELTLPNPGCDLIYVSQTDDPIVVYYYQKSGIFPQVLKPTGIFLEGDKRVTYRKIHLSKDSTPESILGQINPLEEDKAKVREVISGLLQRLE